jgi:superfamily I DNA/RNA helicase
MTAPDGQVVVVGDPYQAIYGFSGAMTNAMANMTGQFNAKELGLTVTHRCPKKVVKLAREWVPEYKAAESNAMGSVTHIPESKFRIQDLKPEDAVLCRVNKPLMDLAFQCVASGKGVRVEGRDIGQTIKSYMQKWPTIKTLSALDNRMQDYLEDQREKLMAKNREQQFMKVEEKVELVRSVLAGCVDNKITRVDDAIKFIDNLFTNGDKDKRQLTTFSSVHKAKGREWGRVYLLGRNEYMPSKRVLAQGVKEFIKQEDNLQYVAVTRVMKDLVEVDVEAKKREGKKRDD